MSCDLGLSAGGIYFRYILYTLKSVNLATKISDSFVARRLLFAGFEFLRERFNDLTTVR
jgi:hypothetical protein